jgi:hypothetical protein
MAHRRAPASPFFHVRHRHREQRPNNPAGTLRVNEMERCGHYRRWREDFELVRELGTWPPDRFD